VLKQNARLLQLGVRMADLAVLSAAFPLAYMARDRMQSGTMPGLYQIASYWPVLALALLLWIATSWTTNVYDAYRTHPVTTELFRLARAMVVVAWAMTALGFLTHQHGVSRLFVGLYFVFGLILLVVDRFVLRMTARAMGRGFNTRRFAVVGCSEFARDIVRNVERRAKWGYQFAGFVVEGEPPGPLAPTKILGSLEELPRLLKSHVLDEVIFAMPRDRWAEVEDGVRLCEEQGIAARVCLDFFVPGIAKLTVDDSLDVPTFSFTMTPSDAVALAAKRLLDIVLSATALVVLSPIFVAVALAIAIDSPGPILFRQKRVGMNGRLFWFYKFRSMHQDAEERLLQLMAFNEAQGPIFKMRQDPRVTRVGSILRRTSLDEFPQFWNVLRGEMSIVGPRPPLPGEVQKYERWQRRRLSMKPGITCIWQVSGRSELAFDRWMELDLEYIDNWSLWHDLKILAKTIPAVLTGRGAH
jgi:exopolysaccharide biosynthesis polyprenyl glycosylphosphotransferase